MCACVSVSAVIILNVTLHCGAVKTLGVSEYASVCYIVGPRVSVLADVMVLLEFRLG